jgi:hypothetical protein
MTTFNWNIPQMDCYPEKEGLTDVVFMVYWQCSGVDGNYSSSVYGTCGVSLNTDVPYTPYAQLTEAQVLGWVWGNGVNKDETEAKIQDQIEALQNPPVVSPPIPWA